MAKQKSPAEARLFYCMVLFNYSLPSKAFTSSVMLSFT